MSGFSCQQVAADAHLVTADASSTLKLKPLTLTLLFAHIVFLILSDKITLVFFSVELSYPLFFLVFQGVVSSLYNHLRQSLLSVDLALRIFHS